MMETGTKMNILARIIFVVVAVFLIAGCSQVYVAEGPAPAMKVDNGYSVFRMNSVAILDQSLQRYYIWENTVTGPIEIGKKGKIAVESVGVKRSPTNTLEVYAMLRNRTQYPLQVQARCQFFDSVRAPVEGPTAWQRIMLPPGSVAPYKEFSVRTDASYYYVEIREGR
jgi:hypothetical protein